MTKFMYLLTLMASVMVAAMQNSSGNSVINSTVAQNGVEPRRVIFNDLRTRAAVAYLIDCLINTDVLYNDTIELDGTIMIAPGIDRELDKHVNGTDYNALRCVTSASRGTNVGMLSNMTYANDGGRGQSRLSYQL
ncbi:uncharacterized protein V2V93DRAFT_395353 [Kockiozyma suomiensis]|uniref:uncharacterized protein n=1 Tax=Kockiozyma suomiensis TaxID=1337062 RepID=UPI003343F406